MKNYRNILIAILIIGFLGATAFGMDYLSGSWRRTNDAAIEYRTAKSNGSVISVEIKCTRPGPHMYQMVISVSGQSDDTENMSLGLYGDGSPEHRLVAVPGTYDEVVTNVSVTRI